jgi:hypothetical protein
MKNAIPQYVLWVLELLSLATILYTSWLLVERPVFALICAVVVLLTCMYIEHRSLIDAPA